MAMQNQKEIKQKVKSTVDHMKKTLLDQKIGEVEDLKKEANDKIKVPESIQVLNSVTNSKLHAAKAN